MNPVNPIFAGGCLLVAIITASLLHRRFGEPAAYKRCASLDGLRGYLAFFVFLHHSSIWFFYLQTGVWTDPPSNLYSHFGQTSAAFFFMITGFLFFSKLLNERKSGTDWIRLFASRFMRLTPLYFFSITLLLLTVGFMTKGTLHEPLIEVIKASLRWFGFTMFWAPDINGLPLTSLIVSRVTWSLPYEWSFYFCLPLLSIFLGARPPLLFVALSALGLIYIYRWNLDAIRLEAFLGGVAAAFLVRSSMVCKAACHPLISCLCVVSIASAIYLYPQAFSTQPLILLSIGFAIITCGNSLFGILTHPVSRILGDVSYGIYLLHGLLLFALIHIFLGTSAASALTPVEYWLYVAAITPILVIGSFIAFRLIELPSMKMTDALAQRIRNLTPVEWKFSSREHRSSGDDEASA